MTTAALLALTPDSDGFARINGIEVTFTDDAGTSITAAGRAFLDTTPFEDSRDEYTLMLDAMHA